MGLGVREGRGLSLLTQPVKWKVHLEPRRPPFQRLYLEASPQKTGGAHWVHYTGYRRTRVAQVGAYIMVGIEKNKSMKRKTFRRAEKCPKRKNIQLAPF